MKAFQKDILVCDFEVTEFDVKRLEPVQVGLILLDKETLGPKWSYASWMKPQGQISTNLEGFRWASLDDNDVAEIEKAPSLEEVSAKIVEQLPEDYYLCAWNATFDFHCWDKLLRSVGKKARTANILDLWSLAQLRLLNDKGYSGNYGSESVFQYFGAAPRTKHYGISDCEIEAMVLRKLMKGH